MTAGTADVLGLVLAGPSDGKELNTVTVSPGVAGFVAMFILAVAVVFLAVDMSRRIRRLQARERVAERHRQEDAAVDAETRPGTEETAGLEQPEETGPTEELSTGQDGDSPSAGSGDDRVR